MPNAASALVAIVLVSAIGCGETSQTAQDAAVGVDSIASADAAPQPDGGADLTSLSDDFSGSALSPAWQHFNTGVWDIEISGGALHLTPNQRVLWFDASQGGLLYREVTGDFVASSVVRARLASNPALPPTQTVHLAGVMARAPAALGAGTTEDYLFIVTGFDVDDLSVETKTTDDGNSNFVGPSWTSSDAELRICRLGSTFRLYKREIGVGTWTLAATHDRPDLPATVQVGPMAYANSDTPDLRASFDQLDFAPVADVTDCTR